MKRDSGKIVARTSHLYISFAVAIQYFDDHLNHILRRIADTSIPILHGAERDVEALRQRSLCKIILLADFFDCHVLTLIPLYNSCHSSF